MKRSFFQRPLSMLLCLLTVMGFFTVCGFGTLAEETNVATWTHKDVLADTDRSETYASNGAQTVLGARTDQNEWTVFVEADWENRIWTGPLYNVSENDVLRIEVDMNVEAEEIKDSYTFGTLSAILVDGAVKLSTTAYTGVEYKALEEKTHPVYGYQYRTLTTTVNTADFGDNMTTYLNRIKTGNALKIYLGNCQVTHQSGAARNFYRVAVVNQTTGQTLYEITGQDVVDHMKAACQATAITATAPLPAQTVGGQVVKGATDIFTDVTTGTLNTVASGDVLRMEVDLGVTGIYNSQYKADNVVGVMSLGVDGDYDNTLATTTYKGSNYTALDLQTDATYGYLYRTMTATLDTANLTADQFSLLKSGGARLVMNGSVAKSYDYKRNVYRIALINQTTGKALYEAKGADVIALMPSDTTVASTVDSIDLAADAVVHANKNITLDGKAAAVSEGGLYTMNFAVAGEANKEYTLTAYAVDGETLQALGSKTFQATGEAETVAVAFASYGDTATKNITFGITTGEGELTVNTVALNLTTAITAEDISKADAVVTTINNLPESLTLEDESTVAAARTAYDALTATQKSLVNNLDKLTTAEGTIAALKADKTAADAVVTAINNLPESLTLEDESAVVAARAAYDALTETQKSLVNNLDKLTAAEATIAQLKAEAELKPGATVATWTHKDVLTDTGRGETYASGGEEIVIGGQTSEYSWVVFCAYIEENPVITGALPTVEKGDVLRVEIDMGLYSEEEIELQDNWLIGYVQAGLRDYFSVGKYPDAFGEKITYYADMWNELEEYTDPVYGYTYRTLTSTVDTANFTDEYMDALNNKQGLLLCMSNSQITHQTGGKITRQFYRVALIDDATGETLYEITNQDVLNHMSEEAAPTAIKATSPLPVGGIDDATDAIVRSTQDIVIDGKTATASKDGLYAMNFAVTGKADRKYTLTAYTVDGETIQAIGSKEFTATGETENIALDFAVTGDLTGKEVTFGITTSSGELTVAAVDLKYTAALEQADIDKANAVITAIGSLPETITLDNEADVTAVRTAYDALTDTQKILVGSIDKLTAAEETLAALKADKEAADAVIAKIDALPAADAVAESDKTAIEETRAAYNGLTDTQKALVSEDKLNKLIAVEEALANLTPPTPAVNYGDVNGDGEKNAADALLALQHSVQLTKLEGDIFTAADVDKSGEVNASDALCILQYSVKLIDTLPVA